ncbi:MAG: DUF547 domain-containing protein [Candidatus Omnitrophica bacterium]|nr:DUF547 domain-containing protein [Candidatus Omnitrophota bacterium]
MSAATRRMGWWATVGFAATLALPTLTSAEEAIDYAPWDALLKRFVADGLVDYAGMWQERPSLDRFLGQLAEFAISQRASRDEQAAFWINAYNACVIAGVLDRAPLRSVKDVKGFFDTRRYRIAAEAMTLNDLEARGRALGEWRVHLALVCASSSCPVLRSEAYVPARLDEQLSDQVTRFLADPARGLRLDETAGVLWVSKLFTWYAKDFVPEGPLTAQRLLPVIAPYLGPALVQAIQQRPVALKFLDYDWRLNAQPER